MAQDFVSKLYSVRSDRGTSRRIRREQKVGFRVYFVVPKEGLVEPDDRRNPHVDLTK